MKKVNESYYKSGIWLLSINLVVLWQSIEKKLITYTQCELHIKAVQDLFINCFKKSLKHRGLTFELYKLKENRSNEPANIYLFKFNNENTRKRCEIRSNLIIKTPERQIYSLLTLNIFHTVFWCFYCWPWISKY